MDNKEKNIKWADAMSIRNRLQMECLKNGHSYKEEFAMDVYGIVLTTTIGGKAHGHIVHSVVMWPHGAAEYDTFSDMLTSYEKYKNNIPKDL